MADQSFGQVEVDGLWVRQSASDSSTPLTQLKKGETFSISSTSKGWLKMKLGWVCEKKDGKVFVKVITKNTNESLYNDLLEKNTQQSEKDKEDDGSESNYEYISNYVGGTSSDKTEAFVKNVRGIYGLPYQWDSLADRRYKDSVFGRRYSDKIVSKMPLLLLTPGLPKFMAGYTKKDKKNILSYITNKGHDDDGILNMLTSEMDDGKFYSFEFAYKQYYACVNPILQRMSRLLNIHDKKIDGTPLSSYRWENYSNDALTGFVSSKESVAFYIDSETQISETFTNSTSESMLSSTVNGLSDMGREIQFLLGGVAGVEFEALKEENRQEVLSDFNQFSEKYLKIFPQELMQKLSGGFLSVASGGKLIFPEIWNDSEFSRNYNIQIKLRTPDADNFSWFMNIAVPLIHLICLTAPRQLSANSYQAPFLVRGYYKGFFNCDMGIITSMDIQKGDKGRWTTNGLPMVVDVNFTLKDLYQIMSITSNEGMFDFLKNTALLDYVANMCGINVNKPDLLRTLDLYYNYFSTKAKDVVTLNQFIGVEQALSNLANSVFSNRILK